MRPAAGFVVGCCARVGADRYVREATIKATVDDTEIMLAKLRRWSRVHDRDQEIRGRSRELLSLIGSVSFVIRLRGECLFREGGCVNDRSLLTVSGVTLSRTEGKRLLCLPIVVLLIMVDTEATLATITQDVAAAVDA